MNWFNSNIFTLLCELLRCEELAEKCYFGRSEIKGSQYYIKKLGKVWDIPQDVSDEIFGLVWPTPATSKPLNIKVIYVVSHSWYGQIMYGSFWWYTQWESGIRTLSGWLFIENSYYSIRKDRAVSFDKSNTFLRVPHTLGARIKVWKYSNSIWCLVWLNIKNNH